MFDKTFQQAQGASIGAGPLLSRVGIVDSVDGGAPPTLTVTMQQGAPIDGVRYLASYTPTATDTVLCLRTGLGSWVVIGEIA